MKQISATHAARKYRLSRNEIGSPTSARTERIYINTATGFTKATDAIYYYERDVERQAWMRHGGPEVFDKYIKKLEASRLKRKIKNPPTAGGPSVSIQRLAGPLIRNYDPLAPNAVLLALKRSYSPFWMWQRCNDALGFPLDDGPRFPNPPQRHPLLQQALISLGPYPTRPPLLTPSPSVDILRTVLERAPDPNRDVNTENIGCDDEDFQGNITFSWTVPYLKEAFVALTDVIKEHGVDDAGWKSIRWEVYDKWSDFPGGIAYTDHWHDRGLIWLSGKCAKSVSGYEETRGRCADGNVYNGVLPMMLGGQW